MNTSGSDLRFFARNLLQTCLGVRTSNRFMQNAAQFFFLPLRNAAQFFFLPPLGKSLNIIEEFDGLSLVDTNFAPRDSPRPLKQNPGHVTLLPSSIGHGGQHDTKPYQIFTLGLDIASGIRRGENPFCFFTFRISLQPLEEGAPYVTPQKAGFEQKN